MSNDKRKAVDTALAQIRKQFGDGAIMRMGDAPRERIESISTGSLGLDIALGIGGLPRGRIVEIYGPESSGKTTLTLSVIAEAQKAGATCAFVDAEHALDPEYAAKLGVRVDDLLVSQPDTGEQALEITDMLVRSNAVDVLIVDSVAALVPKAELEGDMGDQHVGLAARLMSQALRKITGNIKNSNTLVIFINQIRMKIGVMFGSPETTTGGNALKFYASVRMDIRRTGAVKVGEDVVGSETRVKIIKNKVASPFKQAEFQIIYGQGFSKNGEIIDLAVAHGFMEKSGAWYSYAGNKVGQGKEQSKKYLAENPHIAAELERKLREKLLGNNSEIDQVKSTGQPVAPMAALQLRPAAEIAAPVQSKAKVQHADEPLEELERSPANPVDPESLDDDAFFDQPLDALLGSNDAGAVATAEVASPEVAKQPDVKVNEPVAAPAQAPATATPAPQAADDPDAWFQKALDKEVLYQSGPWVYFDGQKIAKGKVQAKLIIEADMGLYNTITRLVA